MTSDQADVLSGCTGTRRLRSGGFDNFRLNYLNVGLRHQGGRNLHWIRFSGCFSSVISDGETGNGFVHHLKCVLVCANPPPRQPHVRVGRLRLPRLKKSKPNLCLGWLLSQMRLWKSSTQMVYLRAQSTRLK